MASRYALLPTAFGACTAMSFRMHVGRRDAAAGSSSVQVARARSAPRGLHRHRRLIDEALRNVQSTAAEADARHAALADAR